MKQRKLRAFYKLGFSGLILFWGLISLACSSYPSEADATKILEAACQKVDKLCKVKSLRKTDGQASEIFNIKHYELVYQAELECLRVNDTGGFFRFSSPPVWCSQIGDIKKVAGSFKFVQSENGWTNTGWDAPREIEE